MSITADDTVVRAPGLLANTAGDETYVMSIDKGKYYGFDEIGGEIWSLVERPIKAAEIIAKMRAGYSGAEEQVTADVLQYLNKLEREGLLKKIGA